jgi:hypothetical protein
MSMLAHMSMPNAELEAVKSQVAHVIGLNKVGLRKHCEDLGISDSGSLKEMRSDAANRLIDTLPVAGHTTAPKLCRTIGQDKWEMGTWILQEQIHEAEREGRAPPTELCVSGLYEPENFLRWKFIIRKLNGVWLNETYFHLRLNDTWILESSSVSGKTSQLYK